MSRKKKEKNYMIWIFGAIIVILLLLLLSGNQPSSDTQNNGSLGGGANTLSSGGNNNPQNNVPNQPSNNIYGCTDSDGGRTYNVGGYVTTSTEGTFFDECSSATTLVERYCDSNGNEAHEIITCTYNCMDNSNGDYCGTAPAPPASYSYFCCQAPTNLINYCYQSACPSGLTVVGQSPFTDYNSCNRNCIAPPVIGGSVCVDTDTTTLFSYGKNPFIMGKCHGVNMIEYLDTCEGSKLREYYCGTADATGTCIGELIDCVCVNGRCASM